MLGEQGRLSEAETSYREALGIKQDLVAVHYNLGTVLKDRGELQEAAACYRQALLLNPQLAVAHANLGTRSRRSTCRKKLPRSYRCAVELKPDHAMAHFNLACMLVQLGRLDDALASYRRAMELKPDWSAAHGSLAYTLGFHPGYDAKAIYEECHRWNRQHALPLASAIVPHSNERTENGGFRVGYVSPDFRQHCQAFFTIALFSHHDHRILKSSATPTSRRRMKLSDSNLRRRVAHHCGHFRCGRG